MVYDTPWNHGVFVHAQTVDTRPLFPPTTWPGYEANTYIDSDTKLQICSFLRPVGDILKLRMPNTQCQPNSFNCGVLAIATATKLTLGKDPLLCYWDTAQMRCHLLQRLEQGKMESFPQKSRRIPLALREETYIVPNSSNTVNMQDFKLVLDKLLWGRK